MPKLPFSMRMWRYKLQFLHSTRLVMRDYTDRPCFLFYSTVPTQDQVLIPETLLKKRKSQQEARAARISAVDKRREVSEISI